MIIRRFLIAVAASVIFAHHCCRAGQIDPGGLHHLDTGLRPVRPHPAAVQGQDRNRREGRFARGTGPAIDTGTPRRRRCGVRPCETGGKKNSWPKVLASSAYPVMYNDFILVGPQQRARRHQGNRRISSPALRRDQGARRCLRFARRQIRHPRKPNSILLEGIAGIDIAKDSQGAPGTRRSARAWVPRSIRSDGFERLCA